MMAGLSEWLSRIQSSFGGIAVGGGVATLLVSVGLAAAGMAMPAMVIAAVLAALAIGVMLFKFVGWLLRKRRTQLGTVLLENHEKIWGKIKKAVDTLKRKGVNLYDLPWVLVVGYPQTGKTEVLRQSRLRFPTFQNLEAGRAGTTDVDFWISEEAVFVDTAGELFTAQGEAQDVGRRREWDWPGFVKSLKSTRPRQPINGLLLVLSAEHLIKSRPEDAEQRKVPVKGGVQKDAREAIDVLIKAAAENFDALSKSLGQLRYPVYIVVTMMDKLPGFEVVTEHLEKDTRRDQMLGWSNPVPEEDLDRPFDASKVPGHLREVVEKLRRRRLAMLSEAACAPSRPETLYEAKTGVAWFAFTSAMSDLGVALGDALGKIFPQSRFDRRGLFVRGIYFTTAGRDGSSLDARRAKLAGVPLQEVATGGLKFRPRPLFITDLLLKKVIPERNLLTRDASYSDGRRKAMLAVCGCTIMVFAVLVSASWYSASALSKSVGQYTEAWENLAKAETLIKQDVSQLNDVSASIVTASKSFNTEGGIEAGWFAAKTVGDLKEELKLAFNRYIAERVVKHRLDEMSKQLSNDNSDAWKPSGAKDADDRPLLAAKWLAAMIEYSKASSESDNPERKTLLLLDALRDFPSDSKNSAPSSTNIQEGDEKWWSNIWTDKDFKDRVFKVQIAESQMKDWIDRYQVWRDKYVSGEDTNSPVNEFYGKVTNANKFREWWVAEATLLSSSDDYDKWKTDNYFQDPIAWLDSLLDSSDGIVTEAKKAKTKADLHVKAWNQQTASTMPATDDPFIAPFIALEWLTTSSSEGVKPPDVSKNVAKEIHSILNDVNGLLDHTSSPKSVGGHSDMGTERLSVQLTSASMMIEKYRERVRKVPALKKTDKCRLLSDLDHIRDRHRIYVVEQWLIGKSEFTTIDKVKEFVQDEAVKQPSLSGPASELKGLTVDQQTVNQQFDDDIGRNLCDDFTEIDNLLSTVSVPQGGGSTAIGDSTAMFKAYLKSLESKNGSWKTAMEGYRKEHNKYWLDLAYGQLSNKHDYKDLVTKQDVCLLDDASVATSSQSMARFLDWVSKPFQESGQTEELRKIRAESQVLKEIKSATQVNTLWIGRLRGDQKDCTVLASPSSETEPTTPSLYWDTRTVAWLDNLIKVKKKIAFDNLCTVLDAEDVFIWRGEGDMVLCGGAEAPSKNNAVITAIENLQGTLLTGNGETSPNGGTDGISGKLKEFDEAASPKPDDAQQLEIDLEYLMKIASLSVTKVELILNEDERAGLRIWSGPFTDMELVCNDGPIYISRGATSSLALTGKSIVKIKVTKEHSAEAIIIYEGAAIDWLDRARSCPDWHPVSGDTLDVPLVSEKKDENNNPYYIPFRLTLSHELKKTEEVNDIKKRLNAWRSKLQPEATSQEQDVAK